MLDTVIIFTSQMKELASFYQQGLKLGDPEENNRLHIGFRLSAHHYLGFDQVEGVEVVEKKQGGCTPWFRVENLDETVQKFIELGAGVRYQRKETPWGDILGSLYDLDGNIFGLSES